MARAPSRRRAEFLQSNAQAGDDLVLQAAFRKMEGDGEVDAWNWTWVLSTTLQLLADGSAEFTTDFKHGSMDEEDDEHWTRASFVYHGRWTRSSSPGSYLATFDQIGNGDTVTAAAAQALLEVQVDETDALLLVCKHIGMDKYWEANCPIGPFRDSWNVSQPHVPREFSLEVHKELPTPVTLHWEEGVISCTNVAGGKVAIVPCSPQLTLAEVRGLLAEKLCLLHPSSIKLVTKHGKLLEGQSEGKGDLIAALLEDQDTDD